MTSPLVVPDRPHIAELVGRLQAVAPELSLDSVLFGIAVVTNAGRILEAMEAHFARFGLSQGRFVVLLALRAHGERDWTPAALADYVGVRRATMTGLLDGLEKEGHIKRRPHAADRRSTVVGLTAKGRAKIEQTLPDHFRRIDAALQPLKAGDRRALARLLAATADAFSTLKEGGKP